MREWTFKEISYLEENYATLSGAEIAKELNRTPSAVRSRANLLGLSREKGQYALYKGDELLAQGTVDEIAETLGIEPGQVYYFGTPTYKNRSSTDRARVLVKL